MQVTLGATDAQTEVLMHGWGEGLPSRVAWRLGEEDNGETRKGALSRSPEGPLARESLGQRWGYSESM
jgi:hypothetical protein